MQIDYISNGAESHWKCAHLRDQRKIAFAMRKKQQHNKSRDFGKLIIQYSGKSVFVATRVNNES